ncbi:MAG TPA: glutamine-hydrolyzing GMP synthase, partial [Longilinea sp.]|nr:glutamine-hydrolyzing GMP synthase [Longilinea sp.]
MTDTIAILDFGSQYSQLIARKVREAQVYCELFPYDAPESEVMALAPKGFILSGGPSSVYETDAPQIPHYVLNCGKPILGICYGMQALTHALGGKVASSAQREYGSAKVHVEQTNALLPDGDLDVWMSHGDRIENLPQGFTRLASSSNSPLAAMGDPTKKYYGVQFHPEVHHTPLGPIILTRFVVEICGCNADWTPASIITQSVAHIRAQVGDKPVLAGVSGGVDSSVAAALVHKAVGSQLTAVFVENGLLRKDERTQVEIAFQKHLGARLIVADAQERFLSTLKGITEPE